MDSAVEGHERSMLDIGVGTGTSLQEFLRKKQFATAVGVDFSVNMLQVAAKKLNQSNLAAADLHALPFQDNSFDLVTSSFVLRSVKQMDFFLQEVKRILKPSGKFAFLDLTRPRNPLFWHLIYRPYLNYYLPVMGRLVSRHPNAYQFLSQSIQTFMEPEALKVKIARSGFCDIRLISLSFGAATILIGKK